MRWTLFNEIIVMSWDTVRGNKGKDGNGGAGPPPGATRTS